MKLSLLIALAFSLSSHSSYIQSVLNMNSTIAYLPTICTNYDLVLQPAKTFAVLMHLTISCIILKQTVLQFLVSWQASKFCIIIKASLLVKLFSFPFSTIILTFLLLVLCSSLLTIAGWKINRFKCYWTKKQLGPWHKNKPSFVILWSIKKLEW